MGLCLRSKAMRGLHLFVLTPSWMGIAEALRGDTNIRAEMLNKLNASANLQTLREVEMKSASKKGGSDNLWIDWGVGHDDRTTFTVEPLNNFDIFGIAHFCFMCFLLCWLYALSIYQRLAKRSKLRKLLVMFQPVGKLKR